MHVNAKMPKAAIGTMREIEVAKKLNAVVIDVTKLAFAARSTV
jgi:hypothetical protein